MQGTYPNNKIYSAYKTKNKIIAVICVCFYCENMSKMSDFQILWGEERDKMQSVTPQLSPLVSIVKDLNRLNCTSLYR